MLVWRASRPGGQGTIRVTLADSWVKDYYLDRQTYLIVALGKAMPIHATGPAVASLILYSDWRWNDSVLSPHRFVEREVSTGRLLNTLQWDLIENNAAVAASELRPPMVE